MCIEDLLPALELPVTKFEGLIFVLGHIDRLIVWVYVVSDSSILQQLSGTIENLSLKQQHELEKRRQETTGCKHTWDP